MSLLAHIKQQHSQLVKERTGKEGKRMGKGTGKGGKYSSSSVYINNIAVQVYQTAHRMFSFELGDCQTSIINKN